MHFDTLLMVLTAGLLWCCTSGDAGAQTTPPNAPNPEVRIMPSVDWRPVDMTSPWPQKGSALDLSRFVGHAPAGAFGRVIRTPEGHLAFALRPKERVRFFGCSMSPEWAFIWRPLTTEAEIEAYAEHVRLQGYNMLRPHFLNNALTTDVKEDLELNPDILDRFDYLVKCLKDRGIYLYLDAMTSGKGYTKRAAWSDEPGPVSLGKSLYVDPASRAHWEAGVRKLLTHLNPYTGTRLVDDPVLAVVLCYNEQEINAWGGAPAVLEGPWREYLRQKYLTIEALKAAWKDEKGQPLTEATSFETIPLFSSVSLWEENQRGLDVESFITGLETEMAAWYVKTLRAMGYQGLITNFDYLKGLRHAVSRNLLDVVSMHGYHDHPDMTGGNPVGMTQTSSLADALNWLRGMASTRFSDRPFLITEYGQVFWNRYRYEEGLAVGAYSALQDFDCLMAHAEPVPNVHRIGSRIASWDVGLDPVARASQVVSQFLFSRGDAAPAPHHVTLQIQPEELFTPKAIHGGVPDEQSRLALVTGFGVSYTGNKAPSGIRPRRPDALLRISGVSQVFANNAYSNLVAGPVGTFRTMEFLNELKAKGLLPADNRTDIARSLYESETGELLLDAPAHLMTVRTPRLEGVSFEQLADPLALGALMVVSSTVPACVTAIALDDAKLYESKRVLLVYATDALNSGMTFEDAGRRILRDLGEEPAQTLMRTGVLAARLATRNADRLKVWALGMDGTRKEALPVRVREGVLELTLDTTTLGSVTPFFEITEE